MRVLDRPPGERCELVRVDREALVTPAGADRERAALEPAQQLDSHAHGRFGRLLHDDRGMDEVDAEEIASASGELVDGRVGENGQNSAALAELDRLELAQRPSHVPLQLLVETPAVAATQHHLSVLQEHA